MNTLGKRSGVLLILSVVILVAVGAMFYYEYNKASNPPNAPQFSHSSGMYEEDFQLTITQKGDADIYYTVDGSEPTKDSLKYEGPITITNATQNPNGISSYDPGLISGRGIYTAPTENVDKCTVIKAVAIDDDETASEVVTNTYFVGINNETYGKLPIVSISMDESSLYDYENGIYVLGEVYDEYMKQNPFEEYSGGVQANYNQRGMDWERKCHIQYFDSLGTECISQDVGIRIQGMYSRMNYQKSCSIRSREEYGEATMNYNFFGEGTANSDYAMLSLQNIEENKYVDPYVSMLASPLDLDTVTSYKAVVVFINGEYWGMYTLRPSVSVEYISKKYDIEEDDILLAKADGYGNYKIESGRARDIGFFNKVIKYADTHDMSKDEYYDELCEMMDERSFASWFAAEIYLANNDCIKPERPDNNVKIWRTMMANGKNEYYDGKWRWMLFDVDKGIGYKNDASYDDMQARALDDNPNSTMQQLFKNLIVNEKFRTIFVNQFRNLGTTIFNQDMVSVKWSDYAMQYTSQLDKYYARFPVEQSSHDSITERLNEVNVFFINRPFYVDTMLNSLDRYLESNGTN